MQCRLETYKVKDFLDWYERKQLDLLPRFQRRPGVWPSNYKSYFLDTLIRGLPTGSIFIRERISTSNITMREVVDGQQRLRTMLDFLHDEVQISPKYNEEYGAKNFSQLPSEVKKRFLEYIFGVNVLVDASDAEVLDMFARLNTFTVKLNKQELRNARYHGEFKTTVYRLASQSIPFFISYKILNTKQIVRMADAELVSELLVTMDLGVQHKTEKLDGYYSQNDCEYSRGQLFSERYLKTIEYIKRVFGDSVKLTKIKGKTLFYSLYSVMYDFAYGLPNQTGPHGMIPEERYEQARDILIFLGNQVVSENPRPDLAGFADACKRHTNDIGPRQTRHIVIKSSLVPLVKQ